MKGLINGTMSTKIHLMKISLLFCDASVIKNKTSQRIVKD